MGFCALNAMFWVSTAGFVGGMAMAPPAARADTAHGRYMAKKRAQVRVATASVHLCRSPRPADARVSASKRRGLSPSGIAHTCRSSSARCPPSTSRSTPSVSCAPCADAAPKHLFARRSIYSIHSARQAAIAADEATKKK